MRRRGFLAAGSALALPFGGCLSPDGDIAGSPKTPCPPIETATECDPINESLVTAEPGAPVDSYRSSILLSVESLPRCERELAELAVSEGTVRTCGTGPPAFRSFARRARSEAEDHERSLAAEGTGYRLYVQILNQISVG